MSILTQEQTTQLAQHAGNIRQEIVKMVAAANSGHPGGSLSAADILTVLYFHEMNVDPNQLDNPDRDRFILSKGHASPVLYATLAEKGYLPKDELKTFRKLNSRLQGHPSKKLLPGVEQSTGSLGQGLSSANGMALAARLDKRDSRVYVVMGDGEIQEGMVWEAAMAAGHYKLDNLVAFVDYNHLQIDGNVEDIMNVHPVDEKFRAFNWHVITIDGHDFEQIAAALAEARTVKGKPTCIVANTVKGKGVSYMENNCGWHGTAPNDEQLAQALAELCGQGGDK
ncbi:transketolase [Aneurinibacillus uraniidurans]|uniref:transketolase n=1 Tax=Aneurinibacillus uraniidurans TaxID=2966586 RepID=UPI0023495DCA|nr:transketolase [Aneurinibacillus sp. B1]WCN38162.1 transketolase [Aneurinibacillus sp. B1]